MKRLVILLILGLFLILNMYEADAALSNKACFFSTNQTNTSNCGGASSAIRYVWVNNDTGHVRWGTIGGENYTALCCSNYGVSDEKIMWINNANQQGSITDFIRINTTGAFGGPPGYVSQLNQTAGNIPIFDLRMFSVTIPGIFDYACYTQMGGCTEPDVCVLSLNGTFNARASDCGTYGLNLCCDLDPENTACSMDPADHDLDNDSYYHLPEFNPDLDCEFEYSDGSPIVPSGWDCNDNITNDPVGCPTMREDCNPYDSATADCAICQNWANFEVWDSSCNTGTCACNDGIDNDCDGFIDVGNDTGCDEIAFCGDGVLQSGEACEMPGDNVSTLYGNGTYDAGLCPSYQFGEGFVPLSGCNNECECVYEFPLPSNFTRLVPGECIGSDEYGLGQATDVIQVIDVYNGSVLSTLNETGRTCVATQIDEPFMGSFGIFLIFGMLIGYYFIRDRKIFK